MVVELVNPAMKQRDPGNILLQFWFWVVVAWGVFAAPLSFLKSAKILGYTSAIAVLCVLYTTVVVLMYCVCRRICTVCFETSIFMAAW
jgi:hypothetical protein